jgi:hypothetical protein
MDIVALAVEVFGVGSLTVAFAKYTLAKKKAINAEDHMKNHSLTQRLNERHNFPY